ncbi:MAG: sortase [Candidatus Shapirobacteria bacterium]|nr:sortase [Candidatus Shapirobacteria bacterium]
MTYIYLKKEKKSKLVQQKKIARIFFLFIGLAFLGFALFPVISFQFTYSTQLKQIIDPLSAKSPNQSSNILGDITTDYTQLSNWFVDDYDDSDQLVNTSNNQSTYYLTIPSLNIKDAVVTLGSMDLKKSLIQYPQTALPGQLGNTVVFGHSVLPQFFSPKNYLTIFSTLYKLKQGDEIILEYDRSTYKYVVEEMFEVKPTNLSVLEQRFDEKLLTLITCSPPGTYLRRLIIKAKLSL